MGRRAWKSSPCGSSPVPFPSCGEGGDQVLSLSLARGNRVLSVYSLAAWNLGSEPKLGHPGMSAWMAVAPSHNLDQASACGPQLARASWGWAGWPKSPGTKPCYSGPQHPGLSVCRCSGSSDGDSCGHAAVADPGRGGHVLLGSRLCADHT